MDHLKDICEGDKVLLVWTDLGSDTEKLQEAVSKMKETVGGSGSVAVENLERVKMGNHSQSYFNKIYSGCIGEPVTDHPADTLAYFLKILAPSGKITIVERCEESKLPTVKSSLVFAGFTDCQEPEIVLSSTEKALPVYAWKASKPKFEVGASRLLSFAKKPAPPSEEKAPAAAKPQANTWTLDDLEDETVELIDEDTLLDESDLVKPDPKSLRVCGTTGKRKACKDCSCGLREELDAGKEPTKKSFTSSCGSCYLGDAFRCGSCPYLGMPAFKPGEKIQLSDRQLNADK
eukprot:TRINITY_DN1997_c0_g1_i7.p1 TRINITY_DN1997_c0_g1~~TRINITY_DN1997_c0_g1_i7.p1  ORF type:complete len:290 (-),score=53.96 TRINITY_DN1997_c0_g1_i7:296-1165(-)